MENFEQIGCVMNHLSTTGAFLTAKDIEGNVNTMTISWGFIGQLWRERCFMVVVRPQRHTCGILRNATDFTVSVPFGTMREQLSICGTKSGRNIDKSQVVSFTAAKAVQSPVVAGCDAYFECEILGRDAFKPECLNNAVNEREYPNNDHHLTFIGKIVARY